ncbi:unnamed protein product [Brassica napus]|uniref:(rape) hypothetical protein n=1 Tax=Brassica napus TaxID=3708 RepID=A0A816P9Z7_BRANA|nr:unnamed protein product [Brassica napus]
MMMYPEAFNRVPLAFFHCQDPSFSLDYCPALAMVQDGERQWHESKLVCAFRSSFSVGFYVRLGLETVTIERQRIQASLRNAPSGEDAIDHIQNDDPMRGLRGEFHFESWSELILVVVENAMVFQSGSLNPNK